MSIDTNCEKIINNVIETGCVGIFLKKDLSQKYEDLDDADFIQYNGCSSEVIFEQLKPILSNPKFEVESMFVDLYLNDGRFYMDSKYQYDYLSCIESQVYSFIIDLNCSSLGSEDELEFYKVIADFGLEIGINPRCLISCGEVIDCSWLHGSSPF